MKNALWLSLSLLAAPSAMADEYHIGDPWEEWNRPIFEFNKKLDDSAIRPMAESYRDVVPRPARVGVRNVFSNLDDAYQAVNNLLQGNVGAAASDFLRFGFNTTWGFLGVLDIASEAGIHKHDEDAGKTLQAWGVPPGPYVVLPVLGPSTVRDAVGTLVSLQMLDPVLYVSEAPALAWAARGIDTREALLEVTDTLSDMALDEYLLIRDIYAESRGESVLGDQGEDDCCVASEGAAQQSTIPVEDVPVPVSQEQAPAPVQSEACDAED
jgi:phospholipid-binding lipoprotein MlaA